MPDVRRAFAARRHLDLPGIAGIALTMGMAVDANVLIYERIREEVRGGRTCCRRSKPGSRAPCTILDSHITTLVAGALLFFIGTGPVKGFAVTLGIGVLTSLFSAIMVTRLIGRDLGAAGNPQDRPDLSSPEK